MPLSWSWAGTKSKNQAAMIVLFVSKNCSPCAGHGLKLRSIVHIKNLAKALKH